MIGFILEEKQFSFCEKTGQIRQICCYYSRARRGRGRGWGALLQACMAAFGLAFSKYVDKRLA